MRQQLIQYVELLFAGAADAEEIKQEILQNTLDRYDDLIAQGKTPEAAYRLAIAGIGDINEILGNKTQEAYNVRSAPVQASAPQPTAAENPDRQKRIAVAVAMYILCPFPLIILSQFGAEMIGLLMMFLLIAAATALLIMNSRNEPEQAPAKQAEDTPERKLMGSLNSVIWAVGLVVYFVISLESGAWYITWLVFPITRCVQGLIRAILDLKEAMTHEN